MLLGAIGGFDPTAFPATLWPPPRTFHRDSKTSGLFFLDSS
jgi:hypothetical protein